MNTFGAALFDTGIGRCGALWSVRGLRGLHLPEVDDGATLKRVMRRGAGAVVSPPPSEIAAILSAIAALVAGAKNDLVSVPLDMDGVPEFDASVYALTRAVPPGQTTTYGAIAKALGQPYGSGTARAVGQALGRNPFAIIMPCHRVVAAQGKMGGFTAHGAVSVKRRLLEAEGAFAVETLELFAATMSPSPHAEEA